MRLPLFIANWKMHQTAAATQLFVESFINADLPPEGACEVVVCAPFTSLPVLQGAPFARGAQNFYPGESGAFTGEIALSMLQEHGVTYVLTGHSERRQIFHENDDLVRRKTHFAAGKGVCPVLCVGEPLSVREDGEAEVYCENQLCAVYEEMGGIVPDPLIIAYEPIWAIGTGRTSTPEDAQKMCVHLRRVVAELFGEGSAHHARLLYGGSVQPDNIAGFMAQPDIDGALVGGASLEADSFTDLIRKGCAHRG